jgi:hypothetical protein
MCIWFRSFAVAPTSSDPLLRALSFLLGYRHLPTVAALHAEFEKGTLLVFHILDLTARAQRSCRIPARCQTMRHSNLVTSLKLTSTVVLELPGWSVQRQRCQAASSGVLDASFLRSARADKSILCPRPDSPPFTDAACRDRLPGSELLLHPGDAAAVTTYLQVTLFPSHQMYAMDPAKRTDP